MKVKVPKLQKEISEEFFDFILKKLIQKFQSFYYYFYMSNLFHPQESLIDEAERVT